MNALQQNSDLFYDLYFEGFCRANEEIALLRSQVAILQLTSVIRQRQINLLEKKVKKAKDKTKKIRDAHKKTEFLLSTAGFVEQEKRRAAESEIASLRSQVMDLKALLGLCDDDNDSDNGYGYGDDYDIAAFPDEDIYSID